MDMDRNLHIHGKPECAGRESNQQPYGHQSDTLLLTPLSPTNADYLLTYLLTVLTHTIVTSGCIRSGLG